MRSESKEALELLVEKANKLKNLSFGESAQEMQLNLSWNRDDQILKSRVRGPNSEQIDAFVLTFRLFIQEKDHCSFQWLADHVLDDPDISDHWKQEFNKAREDLNYYLDEFPSIKLVLDSEPVLTRRDIMSIFIYGDLAHPNPKKREIFKKRMSEPILNKLYWIEFCQILLLINNQIIAFVAALSEAELQGRL